MNIEIERIAFGGNGVGRLPSGKVVFVPFTVPGDTIEVEVVTEHKRYASGSLSEVITPSEDRVTPRCPYFGECGGCQWQHIDYHATLKYKLDIIKGEARKRGLAGFNELLAEPVASSPWGYRTSARLQLQKGRCGFFRRESHELIAVDSCPVLDPRLNELRGSLSGVCARFGISGYAEVYVDVEGRFGISLNPTERLPQGAIAAVGKIAHAVTVVSGQRMNIAKAGPLSEGHINIRPGVFVQKNREVNEQLLRIISRSANNLAPQGRFLELFAGAGNFTRRLASRFRGGVVVDSDRLGISLQRENLRKYARRVSVVRANAYKHDDLRASGDHFDYILADPPRAGLKNLAETLVSSGAKRLVLISCDPVVFTSDAARLTANGSYRLSEVMTLDMFPQTFHFETVGIFDKAVE